MAAYPYRLEIYRGKKSKFTCPSCGKARCFVRYTHTEPGEYLGADVGICDRKNKCGYHKSPREYFLENPDKRTRGTNNASRYWNLPKAVPKLASTIPADIFKRSLGGYGSNHFITYLLIRFGTEVTEQLISRYFIGTSKCWKGATVFYQIDKTGQIRAGKVMLYDSKTGRRVKKPFSHLTWVHKVAGLQDYNLKQCFFGEHLLMEETYKPVAIVESEKTAIIASVYLPQYVWLAAGSMDGLSNEKCKVLRGRKVVLFPDLDAFDRWSTKAKELSHITTFEVFDLLERKVTEQEKTEGLDLADYLIT